MKKFIILLSIAFFATAGVTAEEQSRKTSAFDSQKMQLQLKQYTDASIINALETYNSPEIMKSRIKLLKQYQSLLLEAGFTEEQAIKIVAASAINTQANQK